MKTKFLLLIFISLFAACSEFNLHLKTPLVRANSFTVSTTVNTALPFTLIATPEDVQFHIVSQPSNGSIAQNNQTGSVIFTPSLNFTGSDSFAFKVIKGRTTSNTATVTINVTSSNTVPVTTNISPVAFNEDTQSIITLAYTDVESNQATSCSVSSLTNITETQLCSCSLGVCTVGVTGTLHYNGPASFTYIVSDAGASNVSTATLTITSVNDAPVMAASSITTTKNLPVSGTFTGTDVENDTLTFARVSNGTNGSVTVNTDGTYTYQPNASYSGTDSFTIKANDGNIDSNTVTITVTIGATLTCPTNYLKIAANASLGTAEFCVMKFEAKNSSGTPTSAAAGSPWVSISATDAKTSCTGLGIGHDLIANREWMAIAHLIEARTENWSSGTVGTGVLNLGHTDSSSGILSISDESNSYNQTGNSAVSGWDQRRTFYISATDILWDFSGNVWEWADWTVGGALDKGFTNCDGDYWIEFNEVNTECNPNPDILDYLPKNPANASSAAYGNYGTAFNLGKLWSSSNNAQGIAARGGSYADNGNAGIFTLALDSTASITDPNVGFRCVFR